MLLKAVEVLRVFNLRSDWPAPLPEMENFYFSDDPDKSPPSRLVEQQINKGPASGSIKPPEFPTMAKDDVHSDSDVSDVSEEQEWLNENDDDEGELETVQVISLLDDRVFPNAISMITYCKEKFGFDFLAVRDRLQLDFHGTVKFINFGGFVHIRCRLISYSPSLSPPTRARGPRSPGGHLPQRYRG